MSDRIRPASGGDLGMDSVMPYGEIVKQIIRKYAAFKPAVGEIETETIFDDEHGHYELRQVGWEKWRRIHGCVIHVDIKDGKIWIQHDGIEDGITDELLEAGVSQEDIVLAFHHPYKRKYTGFAVA